VIKFFLFNRSLNLNLNLIIIIILSILFQIFFLFLLPISIEADGAGYYLYAKCFELSKNCWFMWWRPPGFSIYLHFLGMTWLDSFNLVIFFNSLLAILIPILIFETFKPISQKWAFYLSLVLILSTVNFSYTKGFTNDHLYSFFLILFAYFYSRFLYISNNNSIFLILANLSILLATLVRWEAMYIALSIFIFQFYFLIKKKSKSLFNAILVSLVIFISVLYSWSAIRALALGQKELFGSLHNASGRQLFWRVYSMASKEAINWDFSKPSVYETDRWTKNQKEVIFVQEKNGIASKTISSMFPGFLNNPSDDNASTIVFGKKINEYGILKGDELLKEAAIETIISNPKLIPLIMLSITPYFGINIPEKKYFTWEVYDLYEAMPYDIGKTVVTNLSTNLAIRYKASQWQIEDNVLKLARPAWKESGRPEALNQFHRFTQLLRNIIRNCAGAILIFTIWFIPLSKNKSFGIFLFSSLVLMLSASAFGFGYNGRYEHFILPFVLMLSFLSLKSFVDYFFKKKYKE
jgi:hypothetical protein